MPLLSEASFGSFLVYSPKGDLRSSKDSKRICLAIKEDRHLPIGGTTQRVIPFVIQRLQTTLIGSPLEGLFSSGPLLVPAPRSAPAKPGTLYPTEIICRTMIAAGLGAEMKLLLERVSAVPKAATSAPQNRPTAQNHYDSLRVNGEMVTQRSIVVVDDVVTRGTMLLASVSRLKDTYPNAEIFAFALVRTMSGVDVASPIDPCRGVIAADGLWCRRRP